MKRMSAEPSYDAEDARNDRWNALWHEKYIAACNEGHHPAEAKRRAYAHADAHIDDEPDEGLGYDD